jgi:hypothetical protein
MTDEKTMPVEFLPCSLSGLAEASEWIAVGTLLSLEEKPGQALTETDRSFGAVNQLARVRVERALLGRPPEGTVESEVFSDAVFGHTRRSWPRFVTELGVGKKAVVFRLKTDPSLAWGARKTKRDFHVEGPEGAEAAEWLLAGGGRPKKGEDAMAQRRRAREILAFPRFFGAVLWGMSDTSGLWPEARALSASLARAKDDSPEAMAFYRRAASLVQPGETTAEEVQAASVYLTPGKPMQLVRPGFSAEEVHAEKTPVGLRLTVIRNVTMGRGTGDFVEKIFPLTEAEWQGILSVVRENGLLRWTPEAGDPAVFDSGRSGLRFRLLVGGRTLDHGWGRPLKNGEAPASLMGHLGKLAREKAGPRVLFYLNADE